MEELDIIPKVDLEAKARYRTELDAAIKAAKQSGGRETVTAEDGTEAYAYPLRYGGIAWGLNHRETGFNFLRGVRRPDGEDEAVT